MDDVVTYDQLIEEHDDMVCAHLASESMLDWYAEYLLVRLTGDSYD